MQKSKSFLIALAMVALTSMSLEASARAGSSSSSSRSTSSVSRSAPTSAPVRGMQRSQVMSEARAQSPSAQRPSYAQPTYSQPTQMAAPSRYNSIPTPVGGAPAAAAAATGSRFSGGQLAGAAVAGAVGGYLLHGATQPSVAPGYNTNNNYGNANAPATGSSYNSNPGYAGSDYGPSGMRNATAMPSTSSSGLVPFGVLVLVVAGLIIFVLIKRSKENAGGRSASTSLSTKDTFFDSAKNQNSGSVVGPSVFETDLLTSAKQIFRDTQDAINRGDKEALARLAEPIFREVLLEDMLSKTAINQTKVHALEIVQNRVLGFQRQDDRYVGSVHFYADISEGQNSSETIEEVWHFIRPLDGGDWQVAGIEVV